MIQGIILLWCLYYVVCLISNKLCRIPSFTSHIIITGALGAAADPLGAGFSGALGMTVAEIHFLTACLAIGGNVIVNFIEYSAIQKNGRLVKEVLAEVHCIRKKYNLPV